MITNETTTGALSGRIAAAATLARGGTPADAARAAGVGPATISRWRRDAAFVADVDRMSAAASEGVIDNLAAAADALAFAAVRAVGVLADLLTAESEHVRRGAARDILTLAGSLREHVEFAERIEELEARSGAVQGGPRMVSREWPA